MRYLSAIYFPLVLLHANLSSQIPYKSITDIGLCCFWVLLAINLYAIVNYSKYKQSLPLLFIFLIGILCKIISMTFGIGFLYVYKISVALSFVYVGFFMFGFYSKTIKLQTKIFLYINLIVMLLQISGYSELFHIWNTLFVTIDDAGQFVSREIVLFDSVFTTFDSLDDQAYSVFKQYGSNQLRASGLLHSNATLSLFVVLIFSYIHCEKKTDKLKLIDVVSIFTLVFTGAKSVQTCFVLIVFSEYLFNKCDYICKLLKNYIFIYSLAVLLYALIFPLGFDGFNVGAFYNSTMYRLCDAAIYLYPDINRHEQFSHLFSECYNYFDKNALKNDRVGISSALKYLPYIPIIIAVAAYGMSIIKKSLCPKSYKILKSKSFVILIALFICMAANNFIDSPIVFIILGYPIFILFYLKNRDKFVQTNQRN